MLKYYQSKGVRNMKKSTKVNLSFLLFGYLVYIWSYINHIDTFGWFTLSTPVVLISIFFIVTYKKFTFTSYVYFWGLVWAIILLIGAKYTYTYNPLFEYLRDVFNFSRNHYDRLGHFAQGFIPALLIREYLYRKKVLKPSKVSILIITGIVLAFSAFYELLEFAATVLSNRPQSYILDLQGDMWDTQYDMLFALIGAYVSLVFCWKPHNRAMLKLEQEKNKSQ